MADERPLKSNVDDLFAVAGGHEGIRNLLKQMTFGIPKAFEQFLGVFLADLDEPQVQELRNRMSDHQLVNASNLSVIQGAIWSLPMRGKDKMAMAFFFQGGFKTK